MNGNAFFESWSSLGQTVLAGVVAYVALVAFLRVSGKRTLAKLNAFDFVVTVALGSTLASVLTSKSLPLAGGRLALRVGLAGRSCDGERSVQAKKRPITWSLSPVGHR